MESTLLFTPDHFLQDVLNRITDGFYALNPNGTVLYWNKAAEEMPDKSKEEVLGKSLWNFFPDGKAAKFLHPLSSASSRAKNHSL